MRRISFLILLLAIFMQGGCAPDTPDQIHDTDERLLEICASERDTFEKLLSMIQEDSGLQRVDDNWTNPDPPPITSERLASYRALLRDIDCIRGFENFHGKDEIAFIASASGWATSGSSKGYVYTTKEMSPLADTLDRELPNRHRGGGAAYRHIEGNWFLFFEW